MLCRLIWSPSIRKLKFIWYSISSRQGRYINFQLVYSVKYDLPCSSTFPSFQGLCPSSSVKMPAFQAWKSRHSFKILFLRQASGPPKPLSTGQLKHNMPSSQYGVTTISRKELINHCIDNKHNGKDRNQNQY